MRRSSVGQATAAQIVAGEGRRGFEGFERFSLRYIKLSSQIGRVSTCEAVQRRRAAYSPSSISNLATARYVIGRLGEGKEMATETAGASGPEAAPDRPTKRAELLAFLTLAVLICPIVAVGVVGGYGFLVWMSQIILGPPGPPH